ncbi:hypothetical protein [Streptomyces aureus]
MSAFDEKLAAAIAAAGVPLSAELAVPDTDVAALTARLAELETQRAALAERLRSGQTWQQGELAGEELVAPAELREIFGIPLAAPLNEAGGLARLTAPVQALRASWEDRHDGERSHSYRLGHDLPAPGGA